MSKSETRTVAVTGTDSRTWQVTPGVLDRNAEEVFTQGQCHALAFALAERTGWPLVSVVDEECCCDGSMDHREVAGGLCSCQFNHLMVQMPDGRLLDVLGPHTMDEVDSEEVNWCPQLFLVGEKFTRDLVDNQVRHGEMRKPALRVARSFVDPVLSLAGATADTRVSA